MVESLHREEFEPLNSAMLDIVCKITACIPVSSGCTSFTISFARRLSQSDLDSGILSGEVELPHRLVKDFEEDHQLLVVKLAVVYNARAAPPRLFQSYCTATLTSTD